MTLKCANLDKYLMATFLGVLMIVAGLSSTDKWWIAIGGIVLAITLLSAAIDIYGWIHKPNGRREDEQPPSKLRVALMFPLCLLLAAGSLWLGGIEGIILAILLVLTYIGLVFFTFMSDSPTKVFSMTTSIPVGSQSEQDKKLLEAIRRDPDHAEEFVRRHLHEHPIVPDSGLWRTLDALTGGRLQQSLDDAAKTMTVERTSDGFVMRQDVKLDLGQDDGGIIPTLFSTIGGKSASRRVPGAAVDRTLPTAERFVAQGDDLRTRGMAKEARAAYEKAEAHAVVDWANGKAHDRGLLPTVLIRLGKLEAARVLLSEALASAPDDEDLLGAQALLDDVVASSGGD